MNQGNFSRDNQVVKGEYRLSATGILEVSGQTMRHLQNTLEGRENLVSARSMAVLALQNSKSFILNSKGESKGVLVNLEAVSGSGVLISASFRSNNLEASKSGLFFAIGVAVANLLEFYPRDTNMVLQKITTEHKRVTGAYIKSSYLAPQIPQEQPSNPQRQTPKPIPFTYAKNEDHKSPWRDTSLDSWHNPYAPKDDAAKVDETWTNPYAKDNIHSNILDDNLDEWNNPYARNEPILESSSYVANPLEENTYPKTESQSPDIIQINFLDPLAEQLGANELSLSTRFLDEFNIRGLKQALINQNPNWRAKLSSANLMFSVNRQVSMSEFDSVAGGASVTIFING